MAKAKKYRRLTKRSKLTDQGRSMLATLSNAKPWLASSRAHNVVDALYKHFAKWQPEILSNNRDEKHAS